MAVSGDIDAVLGPALARVNELFERQLRSDLPPVNRLCRHIESYRGKMLRPRLVLLGGMACGGGEGAGTAAPKTASSGTQMASSGTLSEAHVTCGAVVEMIHMATLVHDDVLDEADTRRRGETVNRLHGNEAAVMLGDYLIASAYHLCSQLDSPKTSLRVAQVAMTLCAGELLQLSHREDFSLDEATYFEVIDRKTGALVALSCGLGATFAGADERTVARLERFGRKIGLAFQIQDDLLDLTGRQAALGKPVGKDMEKGKLTLPMIHHLAAAPPQERGRSLRLMEAATGGGGDGPGAADAAGALVHALVASGSLAHARETAERMIAEAKAELAPLPAGPARETLLSMADAVLNRSS